MSTACAMSLTRMEEGKQDGVERNRSAGWIGRKLATRAGFTSLMHIARREYTCGDSEQVRFYVQSWTHRQLDYA